MCKTKSTIMLLVAVLLSITAITALSIDDSYTYSIPRKGGGNQRAWLVSDNGDTLRFKTSTGTKVSASIELLTEKDRKHLNFIRVPLAERRKLQADRLEEEARKQAEQDKLYNDRLAENARKQKIIKARKQIIQPDRRASMPPEQLIVGEWKSATETYAPNPEYPNSRAYFSVVDPKKGTGIRYLRLEDGKRDSVPYSVKYQEKTKRSLELALHLSDVRKRKVEFTFDASGTKMVQRMYVTDKFHIDTHHLFVGSALPKSLTAPQQTSESGKPYMVRVSVFDDTSSNPVHPRAEIWFREHGSWWLKPELKYGGTVKNLGTRPSGTQQTLIIYPESRAGKELKVPYMMTDKMNPKGSPRDMISVDISDTEVAVHGLPIKAASGKHELKYKR